METVSINNIYLSSFFRFFDNHLPLTDADIASIIKLDNASISEQRTKSRTDILGVSYFPSMTAETIKLIAGTQEILEKTMALHGLPNTREHEIIGILDGYSGSIERMIKSGNPDLIKKACVMLSKDFRCAFPSFKGKIDFDRIFGDIFSKQTT